MQCFPSSCICSNYRIFITITHLNHLFGNDMVYQIYSFLNLQFLNNVISALCIKTEVLPSHT